MNYKNKTIINEINWIMILKEYGRMLFKVLLMFFVYVSTYYVASEESKKLERRLNTILGTPKKWSVRIIKEDAPNAFCIGVPIVFLHSGLINRCTDREVDAVMLHEIGHLKNYDSVKNIISGTAIATLLNTLLVNIIKSGQKPIVIIFAVLLMKFGNQFINRIFGRMKELKADSFAVKYGYARDLISALRKLEKHYNKTKVKCGKICDYAEKISRAMDVHPPLKERIENILKEKKLQDALEKKNFTMVRKVLADNLLIRDDNEKEN